MKVLKNALRTLAAALSMFTAVPMPQFPWDEDCMRCMLLAFPCAGLITGGLCAAWNALAGALAAPASLRAIGLVLVPVWVSGGIHLDGFADTWDAIASHGDAEKRHRILKDAHAGAFAVLHLGLLLLAQFALWSSLPAFRALPILLSFVLSRALSALSVAGFPLYPGGGLVHSFADAADKAAVFRGALAIALCCGAGMALTGGIWMVLAAAAVFAVYRLRITPMFGGLSGDLSGWFVQEAEVWMLAGLVLGQLLEAAG